MTEPTTALVKWRPGGPGPAFIYKNPATLELHFFSRPTGDVPLTHSHGGQTVRVYSCPPTMKVGDWAAKDSGANTVDFANASNKSRRAFGICSKKIAPTSCEIQRTGEFSGFAGLTPGRIYFLARIDGNMVLPPIDFSLTGLIQQVAVAKSSSIIEVDIDVPYETG